MTEADWAGCIKTTIRTLNLPTARDGARGSRRHGDAVTALAEIASRSSAGEQQVRRVADVGWRNRRPGKTPRRLVDGEQRQASFRHNCVRPVLEFKGLPETDAAERLLIAELRPYQKNGAYTFSLTPSRFKLGALLADDMGSRQTIQALAWLQHPARDGRAGPESRHLPPAWFSNWNGKPAKFHSRTKSSAPHRRGTSPQPGGRKFPSTIWLSPITRSCRRDLARMQKFSFTRNLILG